MKSQTLTTSQNQQLPFIRSPGKMRMYFLLTRMFSSGNFDALRRALPSLEAMQINTLLVSPPNPQSTNYHPIRGRNNHGYWISSHSEIDPVMGGEAGFNRLVSEASHRGIRIAVDAVLNQFGYGKYFQLGEKTISIDDPAYFIQPASLGASGRPRAYEILDQMETGVDKQTLLRLKTELEQLPLYELPTLRHDNPEVFRYLVDSYKTFVDRGIEVFRIDAAKHISSDVLSRFMNELNDHAFAQGKKLIFISEFIAQNSHNFGIFVKELLAKVKDTDSVQFYDFTMRAEFIRLQDANYQFSWMMDFLRYREADRQPEKRYIPVIEDHDFGHPIHNRFMSKLIHVASDFFSYNSPVLYHGSEQTIQTGQTRTNRQALNQVNPSGDLGEIHSKLAQVLAPYRQMKSRLETKSHVANGDHLIVEKKLSDQRSVFIIANKGNGNLSFDVPLMGTLRASMKVHVRDGDAVAELKPGGRSLNLNVNGNGILVLEVVRE
ncbi:MAG: alpha-amylase family glycosyl hydrolase [Bdellovibrionota bacterium]